jgi:trans-2,3-dihydro-3-hydroxyanthranilate isomerase
MYTATGPRADQSQDAVVHAASPARASSQTAAMSHVTGSSPPLSTATPAASAATATEPASRWWLESRFVRRFRYVIVDVFTDTPLAGNPLAVFTDARDLTSEEMQAIAREMNLSETVFCLPPTQGLAQAGTEAGGDALQSDETVFVLPPNAPDADVRIRIFTPALELPFAGHPTLGAAFVLGGPLSKIVIRLETGAGVVPVELERDGARIVFGRMEQPIPTWEAVADPEPIFAALGVAESALPVERYDLGPGHVYVALESAEQVAALQPDIAALARATQDGVNTFARDGSRWKTRMFAPNHGVDEDPATGSAAGPLAVHLARHGWIPFGERIEISQGTEINRPSKLYAEAHGTPDEIERVVVGGSAVTVARGQFSF